MKLVLSQVSSWGDLALIDGVIGSANCFDGNWQGFEQDNLEITIDLGKVNC